MSNLDIEHLQAECDEMEGRGTITKVPGDGFYLLRALWYDGANMPRPGQATCEYLGHCYQQARDTMAVLLGITVGD